MHKGITTLQTAPVRPLHALTRRQGEVLDLLAAGMTNAEIGKTLGISLDGAKWHVGEVLARLNVDSRSEAGRWRRAMAGTHSRQALAA